MNVSDVAAMAASPRYALCALTLSEWCDAAWTMELFGGMRDACEEYACTLVGGNLARGREVTVAVTLTGEVAPGRAVAAFGRPARGPPRRDRRAGVGARPGGGSSGPAGTGTTLDLDAIRRADRPVARVGEAQALARHGATAMIDISDGLGLDLSRLCAASGVGARVALADAAGRPARVGGRGARRRRGLRAAGDAAGRRRRSRCHDGAR